MKKDSNINSKKNYQYQKEKIIKLKEFSKAITKYDSKNNSNSFIKINNKIISNKISFSSIISKNLKKYSITKKNYCIFIINSLILDQKIHIVTEFKNYLLWDESSEFLKRFYRGKESVDRLPNISQYYEIYTLFSPVYFGLEGPLVIIMNGWTRRKRNYLEYIEDKEEEDEKKKNIENNFNFKKILDSKLINSEASDMNDKNSKKTIELTKYDNIDSFFIKDNNISLSENLKEKEKNIYDEKDISLSKIMDNLSSNYSIYIANTYNNKKNEENKMKNNTKKIKKQKEKERKKEIHKIYKNIILSDKVLLSSTNLYKNRNKKFNFQNNSKKSQYGTSNSSPSKVKRSYNEKNRESKLKDNNINNKSKYKIINMPLIDVKKIKNTNKFNSQRNNLQITVNNFTQNKTNTKDKKGKDNIKNYALTNININNPNNINNININSYVYNNSGNNSISKLKIKKEKSKRLYFRNLKIYTQKNKDKEKSPISNTIDANSNQNDYINNMKKSKFNFTRLQTNRDAKFKKYLLNSNITNLKNFYSHKFVKPNNTQINCDPFAYKMNKLMKEKKLSSTNSFSNKHKNNINNNNSKKEKKSIKNKLSNFLLLNKKLSNSNLIRNLVLIQFHSKKEIVHKTNTDTLHHKEISSLNKHNNNKNRNNSLLSKKRMGISNKRLNESLSIKPYKKELNKINLNFNFNINFNIDINKKRKYMISHKNSIGLFTQRNPIIKGNKVNKSKSKGMDNSHKKNVFNSLIKNMKNDYNLRTKK